MLFNFKQKSQDFIVEEILPFELEGKGDAFFVYFEKRNLNTMDVVDHLRKQLGISRLTLGIGGLKDKNAISRQWISIYKSALKKMGGEKVFLNALAQVARVIKTDRHSRPLGMTDRVENMFHIRLRANQAIGDMHKKKLQEMIQAFLAKGFPNSFGEQRFGINKQNIQMGKDLLSNKIHIKENFESTFKLQAYASSLFNDYLEIRTKQPLLEGDILMYQGGLGVYDKKDNVCKLMSKEHNREKFFYFPDRITATIPYNAGEMSVTGPVFGFNTLLCPPHTKAYNREQAFMKKYEISEKAFALYQKKRIFGLRRALRVTVKNINVRIQNDDILLDFSLPGGSYASILVDELLKLISEQTH